MTQEELDQLMGGGFDAAADDIADESSDKAEDDLETSMDVNNYNINNTKSWPPPPLKENKVVHQLDDVTKESEEKATQMFDMLEQISNEAVSGEETLSSASTAIESTRELLAMLQNKFPHIEAFADKQQTLSDANTSVLAAKETFSTIEMNCMSIMDMMQYQDIHRQKIERVINVMRALSNYMNKLFEGKIDDDKRVSSAKHIEGDTTDNLATDDDIEALISAFGQK